MTTETTIDPASDRELATSRLLRTQREKVFRAFRDPHHLANWWGPKDFTNTFDEFDLRPGGRWVFVMHGLDGRDYPNESTFLEVVEPERIVVRHDCEPHFVLTITLTDASGQTQIGWRQRFESAEVCNSLRAICVEANEQNIDRLEAELARMV